MPPKKQAGGRKKRAATGAGRARPKARAKPRMGSQFAMQGAMPMQGGSVLDFFPLIPRTSPEQARRLQSALAGAVKGYQNGSGFFGDVWDGVKSVGNFVKDAKLISKGLSLIPNPYAQMGSTVASTIGLGKKRPPARRVLRT